MSARNIGGGGNLGGGADDAEDDVELVRYVLEACVRRGREGEARAAGEEGPLFDRRLVIGQVEELSKYAADAPNVDRVSVMTPAKNNLRRTVPPDGEA